MITRLIGQREGSLEDIERAVDDFGLWIGIQVPLTPTMKKAEDAEVKLLEDDDVEVRD